MFRELSAAKTFRPKEEPREPKRTVARWKVWISRATQIYMRFVVCSAICWVYDIALHQSFFLLTIDLGVEYFFHMSMFNSKQSVALWNWMVAHKKTAILEIVVSLLMLLAVWGDTPVMPTPVRLFTLTYQERLWQASVILGLIALLNRR